MWSINPNYSIVRPQSTIHSQQYYRASHATQISNKTQPLGNLLPGVMGYCLRHK